MTNHQYLHDKNTGAAYGTYRSYITGFFLSIVITLAAFYIVGYEVFSTANTYIFVAILAVIQLYVQLVFFLHLSTHSKAQWNLISFVFTVIIVAILFTGTLWIMYNLYTNMMLVAV